MTLTDLKEVKAAREELNQKFQNELINFAFKLINLLRLLEKKELGILYPDLKPGNIRFQGDEIRLSDRKTMMEDQGEITFAELINKSGISPPYAAPEINAASPQDKVDVKAHIKCTIAKTLLEFALLDQKLWIGLDDKSTKINKQGKKYFNVAIFTKELAQVLKRAKKQAVFNNKEGEVKKGKVLYKIIKSFLKSNNSMSLKEALQKLKPYVNYEISNPKNPPNKESPMEHLTRLVRSASVRTLGLFGRSPSEDSQAPPTLFGIRRIPSTEGNGSPQRERKLSDVVTIEQQQRKNNNGNNGSPRGQSPRNSPGRFRRQSVYQRSNSNGNFDKPSTLRRTLSGKVIDGKQEEEQHSNSYGEYPTNTTTQTNNNDNEFSYSISKSNGSKIRRSHSVGENLPESEPIPKNIVKNNP